MKNSLLIASLSLLLSQSVLASVPKPDACPSLSAVHERVFKYVEPAFGYKFRVWVNSSLHTSENWTYSMIQFGYPGGDNALSRANSRRLLLNRITGPYGNGRGGWECRYNGDNPGDGDDSANVAITTTPVEN